MEISRRRCPGGRGARGDVIVSSPFLSEHKRQHRRLGSWNLMRFEAVALREFKPELGNVSSAFLQTDEGVASSQNSHAEVPLERAHCTSDERGGLASRATG